MSNFCPYWHPNQPDRAPEKETYLVDAVKVGRQTAEIVIVVDIGGWVISREDAALVLPGDIANFERARVSLQSKGALPDQRRRLVAGTERSQLQPAQTRSECRFKDRGHTYEG
jgi:hypothetical protein